MPVVTVGVEVRRTKDKVYCDPQNLDLKIGEPVIVETDHGIEVGRVCEEEKVREKEEKMSFGKVIRSFTEKDRRQLEENRKKAKQALEIVLQKIEDYELKMKLTCIDYNFDRSKLFIYYTAETRVDFRELIKDLGHRLKTRIQMVQIGVRDEAKILGGLGPCGQKLCCATFLREFQSISLEMVKEQDIPINVAKLSGLCGRLMCCLGYEYEFYCQKRKEFPPLEAEILTPRGKGKVKAVHLLKETVEVEHEDGSVATYSLGELR